MSSDGIGIGDDPVARVGRVLRASLVVPLDATVHPSVLGADDAAALARVDDRRMLALGDVVPRPRRGRRSATLGEHQVTGIVDAVAYIVAPVDLDPTAIGYVDDAALTVQLGVPIDDVLSRADLDADGEQMVPHLPPSSN